MERCTYDPKINYNTPIMDNIMAELGWIQFENVPLFWRETDSEQYGQKYLIVFPVEYKGMYRFYEDWYNEGKLTIEQLKEYVSKHFTVNTANTYSTKIEDGRLLMLAADFYFHQCDWANHYKYVDRFEKETNLKYK